MPEGKLTVDQFAEKIKAKYPDYSNIDNNELTQKILAKYPEYGEQVDFGVKKKDSPIGSRSGSGNSGIGGSGGQTFPLSTNKPLVPSVLVGKAKEQATAKVKTRKEQLDKEQAAKPAKPKADGGVGTSFMRGLSTLNEGLFKIPRYLYDVAAIPQNAIADLANNPEWKANYDVVASGKINPLSAIDRVGDYYKESGDYYEARKEKFNKGIFESLKDGDYKNAGKQLINNISESIPSIAGMYVTGGAGNAAKLGKVSKTLLNALPFASQKNAQIQEGGASSPIKTINATLNGLSEVIYDQEFGTKAILDDVIGTWGKEGAEVATRKAKDFVAGYLESSIKKVQPLTSGVKNAIEEVSTKYSQNLVDWLTVDPDKNLLEGLDDAAITGGVSGTLIQGAGTINGVLSSKKKAKLTEVVNRREEIVNDLDNANLPDDIKEALVSQLEKENDKIAKISDSAEAKLSTLPESEQKEALEAQEKIEALESSLQAEGVSEGTKQRIEQQIEKEQDKLDVLSETSDIIYKQKAEDTEESLTKEFQDAEKRFKENGDQTAFDDEMAGIEARVQELKKREPVESSQSGMKEGANSDTIPAQVQDTVVEKGQETPTIEERGQKEAESVPITESTTTNGEVVSQDTGDTELGLSSPEITPNKSIKANQKLATEEVAGEDGFKPFRDIVNESKSFKEAYKKVKDIKDVPKEVSEAFRNKYDPDKKLLQQEAFAEFYNEVKGTREVAEGEGDQGKEKVDDERIVRQYRGLVLQDPSTNYRYRVVSHNAGYLSLEDVETGKIKKIKNESDEWLRFIDVTDEINDELAGIQSQSSAVQNGSNYNVVQYADNEFEVQEYATKDAIKYKVVVGEAFDLDTATVTVDGKPLRKNKQIPYNALIAIQEHVAKFNPESRDRVVKRFLDNKPTSSGNKTVDLSKLESKLGDPLRSLADKIEQGKISKLQGFRASSGFDAAWDGSLTVIAETLRTGAKLADAIEEGLNYVRSTDWYKSLEDKENFDTQFKSHFEKEAGEQSEQQEAPKAESDPMEEQLSEMGITNKEFRRIREEQGEEQYEYATKSRAELLAEADRLMAEGYSVPRLIKKIKSGAIATDVETELMRRYFVSLTARINKAPTPELLAERKELLSVLDVLKTNAGRAVQAFDGFIEVEDNLASFLQDEGQYYELSPEEVAELTEKYNKAKAAKEALEVKLEAAQAEALTKQAEAKLAKIKAEADRTKKRASIKEDLKAERKQIIDDFRSKLKEIRNSQNAVILPYQRELIALAPFVKRMTESYVKEGVFELKEIVRNIHNEFKDDIDGLTEDDIRDIIAGKHPNPRNTKNAKLAQIRDLERQAKLEAKIAELEAGIISTKSLAEKKSKSDKIEALEKEVKAILKRNPELTAPTRLEARKTWYKNQIENLKSDIREGKFDPIEPPAPVLLDAEALRLKDEYIAFKEETRLRRIKKEHEASSKFDKAKNVVGQILGLKRLVQTSIDLSIPLRQGVSIMLNPFTASKGIEAYGKMLNNVFNEQEYQRMMHDIRSSDFYLKSKEDGIIYTETSSPNPELRDESHPTESFLYKIPYLSAPFRASERAAASWTNYARFELYKRGVKFLEAQGKTRENAKDAYEQMASRVMVDTGRGKIPWLEDKAPSKTDTRLKGLLGMTFYGARLMASTFRKLDPSYYFNGEIDKTVRIKALQDMAGYVTSQILITTALATALGATVSLDWDDPDFMKIRKNKRIIDLTAGQSVYIRTYLRVLNACFNAVNPNISSEDAEKYASFMFKSVGTFFRNKLAPNTSYVVNALARENTVGEKFDPYEILKIYPMYTEDLIKAFKEGNPLDAAVILPIGMLGLGYQEYSRDIRRARVSVYLKPEDKALQSFLKEHQLNITGDLNQEVYSLEKGVKEKMTKEQSDKYEKIWAETVIKHLSAYMPELKEEIKGLSEEGAEKVIKKAVTKAKTQATKTAQEAVSGVSPEMIYIRENDVTYKLTPKQIKERQAYKNEYIERYGERIIDSETRKALRDGKSEEEAKIIAEKKLRSEANSDSKEKILKDYKKGKDEYDLAIKSDEE